MINLKVQLPGLGEIKNPVMSSSGPFHYGWKYAKHYDLNILGTIITKSVTKEPEEGNLAPFKSEIETGWINALGLHNPGMDEVIKTHYPKLAEVYDGKFIANIAAKNEEDFITLAKNLSKVENVGAIEVNISCPNVKDGLAFGTNPEATKTLIQKIKQVSDVPVYVKLSPNVTDIVEMALAAQNGGADAITMINTITGIILDPKTGKPVLSNKIGGVSGKGIFPIALRMVYQVSQVVKIPVIGIGGVSTVQDVIDMMSAGASAVAVGGANWDNPLVMKEIIEALPKKLEELGIKDINDIVGRSWKYHQ